MFGYRPDAFLLRRALYVSPREIKRLSEEIHVAAKGFAVLVSIIELATEVELNKTDRQKEKNPKTPGEPALSPASRFPVPEGAPGEEGGSSATWRTTSRPLGSPGCLY